MTPAIPGGTTTAGQGGIAIRVGQTVMISDNTAGSNLSNKAVVTDVDYVNGTFTVSYYEAAGQAVHDTFLVLFGFTDLNLRKELKEWLTL